MIFGFGGILISQIKRRPVGRRNCLCKFRVAKNVLTNHGPQVGTIRNCLEWLEAAFIIFIVIFAKGDLGPFHFLLFFDESFDDMTVFC